MKKLEVMGTSYEIIENAILPIGLDGNCDPKQKKVNLAKSARDRETLIHELVHAIFFEGGLCQGISEEMTEVVCQQVSQVINKNFSLRFK